MQLVLCKLYSISFKSLFSFRQKFQMHAITDIYTLPSVLPYKVWQFLQNSHRSPARTLPCQQGRCPSGLPASDILQNATGWGKPPNRLLRQCHLPIKYCTSFRPHTIVSTLHGLSHAICKSLKSSQTASVAHIQTQYSLKHRILPFLSIHIANLSKYL